jgi:hypothetical protein
MEKCSFCDQYRSPTKFPTTPAKVSTSVGSASFGAINKIDWEEVVSEQDESDDYDEDAGYIKEPHLENAPFDGESYLLFAPDTGWVEGSWCNDDADWTIMRGDSSICIPDSVTHWTNLLKDPT